MTRNELTQHFAKPPTRDELSAESRAWVGTYAQTIDRYEAGDYFLVPQALNAHHTGNASKRDQLFWEAFVHGGKETTHINNGITNYAEKAASEGHTDIAWRSLACLRSPQLEDLRTQSNIVFHAGRVAMRGQDYRRATTLLEQAQELVQASVDATNTLPVWQAAEVIERSRVQAYTGLGESAPPPLRYIQEIDFPGNIRVQYADVWQLPSADRY